PRQRPECDIHLRIPTAVDKAYTEPHSSATFQAEDLSATGDRRNTPGATGRSRPRSDFELRQAGDLPVRAELDPRIGRLLAEARHQLDVAGQGDNKPGTGRGIHIPDRQRKAERASF